MKKKIVVFISGHGSNLQSIIDNIEKNKWDIEISCVIANRPDSYGLERAKKHNIAHKLIDHKLYANRALFEQEINKTLANYEFDLIVLAGFLRILSSEFVNTHKNKIINIHPSLLPSFKGLHTHQQVLERGAKVHGASIHFVNEALDEGPIIMQSSIKVHPQDTKESLNYRVNQTELIILPIAVYNILEGNLVLQNGQVVPAISSSNTPICPQIYFFENI